MPTSVTAIMWPIQWNLMKINLMEWWVSLTRLKWKLYHLLNSECLLAANQVYKSLASIYRKLDSICTVNLVRNAFCGEKTKMHDEKFLFHSRNIFSINYYVVCACIVINSIKLPSWKSVNCRYSFQLDTLTSVASFTPIRLLLLL